MLPRHAMGICAWLVLGAVAGWIASRITGPGMKMGLVANLLHRQPLPAGVRDVGQRDGPRSRREGVREDSRQLVGAPRLLASPSSSARR